MTEKFLSMVEAVGDLPIGVLASDDPVTVQVGVEVSSSDMTVPEIVLARASCRSRWRVDDDGYGYCSREWLDSLRATVEYLEGK